MLIHSIIFTSDLILYHFHQPASHLFTLLEAELLLKAIGLQCVYLVLGGNATLWSFDSALARLCFTVLWCN